MATQVIYNDDRVRKLIEFPVIKELRGSLTPIELDKDIPFQVRSIRWAKGGEIYSVLENIDIHSSNLVLALSGSAELVVDREHFVLDRPNIGLLAVGVSDLKPVKQSGDLICLVLSNIENLDLSEFNSDDSVKCEGYSVGECRTIDLSLSQTENVPFPIKRLFYIYDIPDNVIRGGHTHKSCHEVLIALQGAFDIELSDGYDKLIVELNDKPEGLFLPAGIWAKQTRYKDKALCLVFASEAYDEAGYIYTYENFLKFSKK